MKRLRKFGRILANPSWLRALVRYRVAAATEHIGVLHGLNLRTIVDIGANRGQFALVARYCCPNAVIYSFEPLASPAETLRRIFSNDARTHVIKAGVAPKAGSAEMHVAARDDSSSLLPISDLQTATFPGTGEIGRATVTLGPLGDFVAASEIRPPAMLKLDVQGYELEALIGCKELLPKFEWVYAECSFVELYAGQALAQDVVAKMAEWGYDVARVQNISYDAAGIAVQADFLFRVRLNQNLKNRGSPDRQAAINAVLASQR